MKCLVVPKRDTETSRPDPLSSFYTFSLAGIVQIYWNIDSIIEIFLDLQRPLLFNYFVQCRARAFQIINKNNAQS